MATQFAAAGADVATLARRADVLEEAKRAIGKVAKGKITALPRSSFMPVLPARIRERRACLLLPQNGNDLLFRKSTPLYRPIPVPVIGF